MEIPPTLPPHLPHTTSSPGTPGQQATEDARWIAGLMEEVYEEMMSQDSPSAKETAINGFFSQLNAKADDLASLAPSLTQYPFLTPMAAGLVTEVQNVTAIPASAYATTPPDPNDVHVLSMVEGMAQITFSLLDTIYGLPP